MSHCVMNELETIEKRQCAVFLRQTGLFDSKPLTPCFEKKGLGWDAFIPTNRSYT